MWTLLSSKLLDFLLARGDGALTRKDSEQETERGERSTEEEDICGRPGTGFCKTLHSQCHT
uniref:Uncharacterized protein n=1 Tax=Cynoglossus semilaevis TaxID=244447 RepID=A0A3P8UMJ0_CYNSE